jgi:hypothetical protein
MKVDPYIYIYIYIYIKIMIKRHAMKLHLERVKDSPNLDNLQRIT